MDSRLYRGGTSHHSSLPCLAFADGFQGDKPPSVAATVHEAQKRGLSDVELKATDHPYLNAQSPSERWDGDCARSYTTLSNFDQIFSRQAPAISLDSHLYRGGLPITPPCPASPSLTDSKVTSLWRRLSMRPKSVDYLTLNRRQQIILTSTRSRHPSGGMATARGVTQRSTTSIKSFLGRRQRFLWTVASTEGDFPSLLPALPRLR
jgi:hypothetical protein